MQRNRIFGTPPEPVFNMISSGLAPELLEEILYVLAEENEKNMDCVNERKGYFKGGRSAEYIFLLCQEMELPTEARFQAIELFDKFMVKHVCDLYEVIRSSEGNQQHDWSVVEDRVKAQLPLRAVSCLQIASKLASHYKAISPNKARRFLSSIGHRYTIESVLKSEMRVLKTLDYHILTTTPLTYLETILEILGHNDTKAQVKLLHEAGVKILDIVYLKHHEIYSQLCMTATGEQCCKEDRHKLAIISSDLMLLAVAITGAAAYIINQSTSDVVVEQLSRITQIPENNILDFATILIEHIL